MNVCLLHIYIHTCTQGCIVKRQHARTLIVNKCAKTYALFAMDEEVDTVRSRDLMQMLSGDNLPEVYICIVICMYVHINMYIYTCTYICLRIYL